MNVRSGCVVACLLALAGVAQGQSTLELYGVAKGDHNVDLSTAPDVAVGADYSVVIGSHKMLLFAKAQHDIPMHEITSARQSWSGSSYAGYPFQPAGDPPSGVLPWLTFPRAEYDPVNNAVWMLYSESAAIVDTPLQQPEDLPVDCTTFLHLATTRVNANVTTFDACLSQQENNCWVYLTGSSAINVGSPLLKRFHPSQSHVPFLSPPRYPSMAFDERAVFVTASEPGSCAAPLTGHGSQAILIIPREFTNGSPFTLTIPQGFKPDEDEITIVRFGALEFEDNAINFLAVQEPHDHKQAQPQFENITLFISTDGTASGLGSASRFNHLRLRGLFWDDSGPGAGQWAVRQSLMETMPGSGAYVVRNIEFDESLELLAIFGGSQFELPRTPDEGTITADNEAFTSAVLAKDNQGNPRVFAVHSSFTLDHDWVVQWYVIDPDLENFHNPPAIDGWVPEVVQAGRIAVPDADCSLPALAVSTCGGVMIEYTFSSETVYPQIRRAILNNSYDGVLSDTLVKAGPDREYGMFLDRWAMRSDMQSDPVAGFGGIWSTHTLVGDTTSIRDVWLMRSAMTCFTTDLNADGVVDPFDLMLYGEYYITGDERADTNADGVVDVVDMDNFLNAYQEATRP